MLVAHNGHDHGLMATAANPRPFETVNDASQSNAAGADTMVDSLKALDPRRPIREADIARLSLYRAAVAYATATLAPPIARAVQELVRRNFEAP